MNMAVDTEASVSCNCNPFLSLSLAISMDFSPSSRRAKPKSDIYSTVVIHNSSSESSDENPSKHRRRKDDNDDKEDDDDSSLPLPLLLQRLPKDFGIAPDDHDDNPNHFSSGTVIFKSDRSSLPRRPTNLPFADRNRSIPRKPPQEEDPYSTFLVKSTARHRSGSTVRSLRESVSGTVIRRTGGGGSYPSFRGVEREFGFGEGRKDVAGAVEETRQQPRKISASSIPYSVITREDPSTKDELLNELGEQNFVERFNFDYV